MVALSKMTKYPFYRFRVGVRADFQDFVIVGEHRDFHNIFGPDSSRYLWREYSRLSGLPARRNRGERLHAHWAPRSPTSAHPSTCTTLSMWWSYRDYS